jgi:hypothetical protein
MQIPKTRAECVNGPRPCPYTKCKYWTCAPHPSTESCWLDVYERGGEAGSGKGRGLTYEEIGAEFGVSTKRAEQLVDAALLKLRKAATK